MEGFTFSQKLLGDSILLPYKASQDYSIKLQMLSTIRFLACRYCMGRELLQKKTILSSENTLQIFTRITYCLKNGT